MEVPGILMCFSLVVWTNKSTVSYYDIVKPMLQILGIQITISYYDIARSM